MQEALTPWITPAIVVLGFIFTWRTIPQSAGRNAPRCGAKWKAVFAKT